MGPKYTPGSIEEISPKRLGRALRWAAFAAAASTIAIASTGHARDAADETTASAPGLEEIVVTAQKREQSLQAVPISVSALTGDTLTANRITTSADLGAVVPNLVVRTQVGGSGLPSYTMRGLIGIGGVIGSDKGISVYIDGVYLGAAYGSIIELGDISRIEVLRGPQGTLFGRNSNAGAINYITPEPNGQFGMKQVVTVGNYDQFRTVTSVQTPQFGQFSARFSYTHNQRRGDIRNLGAGQRWDFTPANGGKPTILTSPKYLGDINNEAFTGAIKFEPGDRFDALVRFDYAESDFTTLGLGASYANPTVLAQIAAQPNQSIITQVSRLRPDAVNNSETVPGHSDAWGVSLTARYRFSDAISIKNVVAYRRTRFSSPFTNTAGIGGLINTGTAPFAAASVLGPALAASTIGAPFLLRSGSNGGTDQQWSNEFQLLISTDFVTLTAGGLYFDQTTRRAPFGEETGLGRVRSVTNAVYPGGLVPFSGQPVGTLGRETTLKVRSYAAYAQGEFHVMPNLDLVGGIRYTSDRKTGTDNTLFSGADPRVLQLDYRDGVTTFSLGANFDVSKDIHLYAKYSTGFISGGSTSSISYEPETAKSWEAGLKADWFGRTLRTNLAVFSVDYGNLQIPINGRLLTPPQPAITSAIQNAGDARAKGFELETTFVPTRGLVFSGGLGYTDFKFLRLLPAVLVGNSEFLAQYRPKWTLNLSGQYETPPIWGDAHLSARVDTHWKSEQQSLSSVSSSVTGAELIKYKAAGLINAYWVFNGRIALEDIKIGSAKATVALWSKNLFDNKQISYSLSFLSTIASDYERARTFGIDLTLEL
jgi:iron complex outermembrane receptor protein